MPEGKRARPEGTKYPSADLLPEAIFNYVLTVEEYVSALSEGEMPENCERARKFVKEPGKVRETMQMISFFIHVLSGKHMCERAKTYSSSEINVLVADSGCAYHVQLHSMESSNETSVHIGWRRKRTLQSV